MGHPLFFVSLPLFFYKSMRAYIFPGQGAQFSGMGSDLYRHSPLAKQLFEQANEILGFDITQVMFEGTEEELKQTHITQPAVFLHSVIEYMCVENVPQPEMVAGHSLGEFSALVACKALRFEDALKLVFHRAQAMQRACERVPSTMAVVLKAEDAMVEEVCASISDAVVVPANYNCPGQLVISGSNEGVELAVQKLKEAGVRRILPLNVGGAFHSPLMLPAQEELSRAINEVEFQPPVCPIFQNSTAEGTTDVFQMKENLKAQLTNPVRWTQSVQNMIKAGATQFVEFGPGNVLQGLVSRINAEVEALHG